MTAKAKLAFDLLEKELNILDDEQKKNVIGGDIGQVVGGSGTATDPILIYAPIYYGADISSSTINGILSASNAINDMTASSGIAVNGKFYKYMVAPIQVSSTQAAMNQAGALGDYAGAFSEGYLGLDNKGNTVLGLSGSVSTTIDPLAIAMANGTPGFGGMNYVVSHEIGHLFGLDHSSSSGSGMGSNAANYQSGLTQEDIINIIKVRGF